MATWYIRELSQLTHISVQTLHHYDRIGLLKPSLRLKNRYRVYSEEDLQKLQQIISLKFFGFDLSQIAQLLHDNKDMYEQLTLQSGLLEEKAQSLLKASDTLKHIISNFDRNKPIRWEKVIESIDIYRTTQQLEKSWVGKILDQDELKQYVQFEKDLKSRFTEKEIVQLYNDRAEIIREIDANLDKDPSSEFGANLAKRGMKWANHLYGRKYTALRINIWIKGYRTDFVKQVEPHDLASKENVAWFDKAVESYYFNRVHKIFEQLDLASHEAILPLWEELLTEMCGDVAYFQNEYINTLVNDSRLNQKSKNWLKSYQRNIRSN